MNKFINGDLSDNFTVIVSVIGASSEHALFMNLKPFEPFQNALSLFPVAHNTTSEVKSIKSVVTQFVITSMGEADDSSKNQQLGRFTYKGKNKVWPEKPAQDQIAAEIISQIWDRVCGKLKGSSFTYKSNKLEFSAVFDSQKNKYVVK